MIISYDYDSGVVIYECRTFIRMAIELNQLDKTLIHLGKN